MSDIPVTPAPDSLPIICGVQEQVGEFARGWRPRGTHDWLLVMTTGGQGYVRADGRQRLLSRGDILLISPDTPQEYGYVDENSWWSNIWAHFRPRPHWLSWLNWPSVAPGVMVLDATTRLDEIEAELRRMVEVDQSARRLSLEAAMNALERALISADDINPLHASSSVDPRIRRALDIVGERLKETLSVDELARSVGLSRSRFSVLFSRELNISPQSYIELARLGRAAQLLMFSSSPVSQIAEEVGFPNAYYFSTRFRRQYGLPPTQYRAHVEHDHAGASH
ncbi:MAG TPA: helix-turn-helix domain-containing protein [Devosia sp.]|jgi:AraC family transcriptional regulator of arabinose operon|uniref:helix-turn-helix domain-containing protein n=1 Tax=Devosia sp. TaxID=1871048 RepID=UPI002DDDAFB3|nr:helix-turn-helix domain-containing protein [Devosia sp.]HEV2514262.1 helix-turn-helix domain-containing protein [Devosia sp.]